jgi:membrane associated rhomboid family serine protease
MKKPVEYSAVPARQPEKRPTWKLGGATILSFVALLYLIELIDQLAGHSLDRNGIRPLQFDGLTGIVVAPLLHANWQHLFANTVPALVLGFLVTLAGMARFLWATAIIWIVGGFGTWLIGGVGTCPISSNHIGASGLIFGWLTFLLLFGWFTRHFWQIVLGLVVLVGYGSVLWGVMPVLNGCGGVSWQGHLCGAIAGVLAAYWLAGPERKSREQKKLGRLPGPVS